jgi:peptidyl-prolyl cis-trans isomerase A (cyclophilin A)
MRSTQGDRVTEPPEVGFMSHRPSGRTSTASTPRARSLWQTRLEDSMTTATFVTNRGTFSVILMPEHAPVAVENFVGLASGTKSWTDPIAGEVKTVPLYSGTVFHRVIDGFMIQGGDPLGRGTGGPGYTFEDEVPPDGPTFNQGGKLAMANAGPATNGSQFFVTVAETPWLNGKHTIFGQVTEGMDVVEAISKVDTDGNDRPTKDIMIERIDISD